MKSFGSKILNYHMSLLHIIYSKNYVNHSKTWKNSFKTLETILIRNGIRNTMLPTNGSL